MHKRSTLRTSGITATEADWSKWMHRRCNKWRSIRQRKGCLWKQAMDRIRGETSMVSEIKEAITKILTDILGASQPSMTLEQTRARTGVCFYYQIPNREPILGILNYLRETYPVNGDFPLGGLSYPLYDARTKNTKKEVSVQVTEREDHMSLRFSPMDEIRFHRSYGKQIVASIHTDKESVLELLVGEDWAIWTRSKAGNKKLQFNWWLNKCLRENDTIRRVIIALLRRVGKELPIYLDVARTIERDRFFFPPLDFDEIKQCHTPTDLIEKTGVQKLDINYNKLDINVGYYLSRLADCFDEHDGIQLRDYPKTHLLSYIQPKDLFEGPNAERFLTMHYLRDADVFEPWQVRQEITDYLQMCIDQDLKPQILPSYDAFVRKHDEMTEGYRKQQMRFEIQKPLVPEHSQFEAVDLAFRRYGMENYEWIRTGERLYQEGEKQHNCVFTYRASIRKDLCAIFHLDRNGESYTIRINKNPKGRFYIADMKRTCNHDYLRSDYDYVNGYLRYANDQGGDDLPVDEDHERLLELFGNLVQINNDGDVPPPEEYTPWEPGPDITLEPFPEA